MSYPKLRAICIFILLFNIELFSQSGFNQSDNSSILFKFNILLESDIINSLTEYDSTRIMLKEHSILIDNLKCISELIAFYKEEMKGIPYLSLSNEILSHQRQKELLLVTSKEFYTNQPDLSLGEVGKYLGFSKRVAAIVLAIMSL